MKFRTLWNRVVTVKRAHRTTARLGRFRTLLEPLESRAMLSAVNWTVDSAQSSMTLAIPDQTVPIATSLGDINTTIHFGNQSQTNDSTHAWNVGNTAAFGGTLATDYVDGSSLQLLDGQSSLTGITSGNYIPNPAVWNAVSQTYADQSTAPAEFGVRIHATALSGFVSADAAYVAISNVAYNAASGALSINGSGQFAGNTSSIGISSGTFASLGLNVPVVGQLPSYLNQLSAGSLAGTNTTPTGTITTPDPIGHPLNRHLSLSINIPTQISVTISGQNVVLTATMTGQMVADTSLPPSTIVGRNLFYHNSSRYDVPGGSNPAVTPGLPFSDDNAIATDKSAYLPNGSIGLGTTTAATFASVSSYDRGINGIMIDMAGTHGSLSAADFVFRTGNNNTSTLWTPVSTAPTVLVRPGAGAGGSDRIELIWPDGTIKKAWLEVIVKGNDTVGGSDTNTGLAASDTFFFGNAVGDSGNGDTLTFTTDTLNDELGPRGNPKTLLQNIPITNIYDYNRDGKVDTIGDELLARGNPTSALNAPKFIKIGVPPAAPVIDAGLGSGLTAAATVGAGGGSTAPGWLSNSLGAAIGSGKLDNLFRHLAATDTSTTRKILLEFDGALDALGIEDEVLDSLLVGLGLE